MTEAWRPVDGAARRPGFHWMDIIMALDVMLLVVVFGAEIVNAIQVVLGKPPAEFTVTTGGLWFQAVLLFTLLGLVPFLWVLATRIGGWQGTLDYFGLRRPGIHIAWGAVVALGLLALVFVIGLIALAAGRPPENPAIGPLQNAVTWPTVIALSLAAAFGEEILFRGVLQKYARWWGQALIFGALHAYQGVYGIVLTLSLGLLFGYIVHRHGSLWIPISAHFFFNFLQLSLLLAL